MTRERVLNSLAVSAKELTTCHLGKSGTIRVYVKRITRSTMYEKAPFC